MFRASSEPKQPDDIAPLSQDSPLAQPRQRAVIERVHPEIDGGRFPIKRIVGDWVTVSADVFADGHDLLSASVRYRFSSNDSTGVEQEAPMHEVGNDRWTGLFQVTSVGRYEYTIEAWIDRFESWRRDLKKKAEAGQDVFVDLLVGATLVEEASERAPEDPAQKLLTRARGFRQGLIPGQRLGAVELETKLRLALDDELSGLMARHSEKRFAARYDRWLSITVDREKARFSAWYELFPRSTSPVPGKHGTFKDCEAWLPYVSEMGFDVLYLPPIHPIGRVHRKGKNNAPAAELDDVGSPWAIGAAEGGHKAIDPQLGTLDDFRRFASKCREYGLEIALDLAFQCAPDHPDVKEHPEWFRRRPDGTIQYAENPPKKYEDIYPFDFENEHWIELWDELKSVVLFWIGQGVRIFRVDNPHTKPFSFWEWLIREVRTLYPDVLFLSEAFTRPKVMHRLAKLGFTHSYTYFAWRDARRDLTEYFTELTQTEVREYFRPHLWPNTPDILTEYLQAAGRPAFMTRFVMAATLGANYGVYGPAFELCENTPIAPGKEEYLNAEKYELKHWNINSPQTLRPLIARVNQIRRENPALQSDVGLHFHRTDNDQFIAYSKATGDRSNVILVIVNLDPRWKQSGWTDLSLDVLALDVLGIDPRQPYRVHDLLTDVWYTWQGPRNYVELNPYTLPAHVFRVER